MNAAARLLVSIALVATPLLAQSPAGSSASVKIDSGPHKGTYDFAPTEACVLAGFGKKPPRLSVVMASRDASLSLDMPNIDDKHSKELQIVLVVADRKGGATMKAASVTYEIDTRPDSVLEPFQKAERANKGTTGKVTTTLMQQAGSAMLTFSGETQSGVKLSGEITCRKVAAE